MILGKKIAATLMRKAQGVAARLTKLTGYWAANSAIRSLRSRYAAELAVPSGLRTRP